MRGTASPRPMPPTNPTLRLFPDGPVGNRRKRKITCLLSDPAWSNQLFRLLSSPATADGTILALPPAVAAALGGPGSEDRVKGEVWRAAEAVNATAPRLDVSYVIATDGNGGLPQIKRSDPHSGAQRARTILAFPLRPIFAS